MWGTRERRATLKKIKRAPFYFFSFSAAGQNRGRDQYSGWCFGPDMNFNAEFTVYDFDSVPSPAEILVPDWLLSRRAADWLAESGGRAPAKARERAFAALSMGTGPPRVVTV